MKTLEYYINKNKHTCVQLPQKVSTCLQINNYLSEYTTDSERQQVLHNLGLDNLISTLQSDLDDYKELINDQIEQLQDIDSQTRFDFFNSGIQSELKNAILEVPTKDRKLGEVITFKNGDVWECYQFTGDTISDWNNRLYKNWKKLGDQSQFGVSLKASVSSVSATNEGTKVILHFKSIGNLAYDINIYKYTGLKINKELIHSEDFSGDFSIQVDVVKADTTFEVEAFVNGGLYTQEVLVPVTYPMWVGMGDSQYGKVSDVWQFPKLNTKIRKQLKSQEFRVNNVEASNSEDNQYLYIAVPRKSIDLLKVGASLNGFEIPLTKVGNVDVETTYNNLKNLTYTYKVYKSSEPFVPGKYNIDVKIYQMEISNSQQIEENFSIDDYENVYIGDIEDKVLKEIKI